MEVTKKHFPRHPESLAMVCNGGGPPDAAELRPLRCEQRSWIVCRYTCQKPKRLDAALDILTIRPLFPSTVWMRYIRNMQTTPTFPKILRKIEIKALTVC